MYNQMEKIMTIEELQKAKIKLDKDLTDAVKQILSKYYDGYRILPSSINIYMDDVSVYVEEYREPLMTRIECKVKTEFRIA